MIRQSSLSLKLGTLNPKRDQLHEVMPTDLYEELVGDKRDLKTRILSAYCFLAHVDSKSALFSRNKETQAKEWLERAKSHPKRSEQYDGSLRYFWLEDDTLHYVDGMSVDVGAKLVENAFVDHSTEFARAVLTCGVMHYSCPGLFDMNNQKLDNLFFKRTFLEED